MNPWWVDALTALVYACIGYLSVQLGAMVCANVVPFEDGPRPGRPPVTWLVLGSALVGCAVSMRGANLPQLAGVALVIVALVGSWYSDVKCGIVPDYFTLIPLAIFLLISLAARNYQPLVSAAMLFVPFAIAAFASKGRGMGWGDVKLVTLGAAILGWQPALMSFAAACLIATFVAMIRRRRKEPIAFAPYIATATCAAIALPLFPM